MKNESTEAEIQATCFDYVHIKHKKISHLFFAIPNGGKRDIKVGACRFSTGSKRTEIITLQQGGEIAQFDATATRPLEAIAGDCRAVDHRRMV